MMTDRATATAWVRDLAARRWDAALAGRAGFTRAANATVYTRKVSDGGRQRIHLDIYVRPSYAPHAFHLSLRCSVAFPEMAKAGAQMFGEHASGFGKSGTVHISPLDLIVSSPTMMFFASAQEIEALGPVVERHFVDVMVPYLDQRMSVAALTDTNLRAWDGSGAEPGDVGRLPVIVAAGQLALGEARQALQTLETAYPEGTGARERYADAFGVVEAAVRKAG
jgi:hypothetical protein